MAIYIYKSSYEFIFRTAVSAVGNPIIQKTLMQKKKIHYRFFEKSILHHSTVHKGKYISVHFSRSGVYSKFDLFPCT